MRIRIVIVPIITDTIPTAKQIIDSNWHAVVTLANALIERKKIPADEVKEIIDSALVK